MRTLMVKTSLIGITIMAAAVSLPASAGPQYYGSTSGTIRCESNDGRTAQCATGGGQVVIERQLSSSACIEGRTWGYGGNGIWVSQGCRADFRIVSNGGYQGGNYGNNGYGNNGYGNHGYSNNGYGNNGYGNNGYGDNGYGNTGYGSGQVARCESIDGRNRTCAMDTRGGVQLVRKLSNAACIEGRSWGASRGGVWVTDGCRAEFRSGGNQYGGGYGNGNNGYYGNNNYGMGSQVFRCESNDGRTRECAANTRAGVQLVRVLSNAACIEGRSWGYSRNGIWVSQGCRAEFRAF